MPKGHQPAFLVTGATGFVGSAVVRKLREGSAEIRCLVRSEARSAGRAWLEPPVTCVSGCLEDPEALRRAMEGCDVLINCLGLNSFWERDRSSYHRTNVEGTAALMRAALEARVPKVVHVSTIMAYGFPAAMPFREDSVPGPHMSEYARSKHEGDCLAVELHENQGLPLVIVFLAAVVGRGDPKSVMQIRKFVDGGVPMMIRSPNLFTYVDIADAATAIVRAAEKDGNIGERYLVGSERLTTEDYFRIISRASGEPMPTAFLGRAPALALSALLTAGAAVTRRPPLMPYDLMRTVFHGPLLFDGGRAARELGFTYRPIGESLADAVAEVLESRPNPRNSRRKGRGG
jgi:dihydroflavonol-4-reductase